MSDSHFGICVELTGVRPSQYANYNFNSMCRFGGLSLGANEHGIFKLDDGEFDYPDGTNRVNITAYFTVPSSDFGIPSPKTLRRVYIGYEADGAMKITSTPNDSAESVQGTLNTNAGEEQQNMASVDGRRDLVGRYWELRLENINGSDFSIDSIAVLPIPLGMGRRR